MIRSKQTKYAMHLMRFLVKSNKEQEKRRFIITTNHKQTHVRSLSCFCDGEQFAGTLYLNSFVDSGIQWNTIHCSNSKIIIIIKNLNTAFEFRLANIIPNTKPSRTLAIWCEPMYTERAFKRIPRKKSNQNIHKLYLSIGILDMFILRLWSNKSNSLLYILENRDSYLVFYLQWTTHQIHFKEKIAQKIQMCFFCPFIFCVLKTTL